MKKRNRACLHRGLADRIIALLPPDGTSVSLVALATALADQITPEQATEFLRRRYRIRLAKEKTIACLDPQQTTLEERILRGRVMIINVVLSYPKHQPYVECFGKVLQRGCRLIKEPPPKKEPCGHTRQRIRRIRTAAETDPARYGDLVQFLDAGESVTRLYNEYRRRLATADDT